MVGHSRVEHVESHGVAPLNPGVYRLLPVPFAEVFNAQNLQVVAQPAREVVDNKNIPIEF